MAIGKRSNGTPVIVSTGEAGPSGVWKLNTGKPRASRSSPGTTRHAVATGRRDDGTPVIISSGEGHITAAVHIWNLDTGKLIGSPIRGHYSGVMDIEVAKRGDGTPIFITGSTDSRVRVWNLEHGQAHRQIPYRMRNLPGGRGDSYETPDGTSVIVSTDMPGFPL